MLLDQDEFLKALPRLFEATKEKGGVTLTIKRFDYQGKKQERQKKRAAQGTDEDAMRLLVDKLSLDENEYATLVRAATETKKISSLVAPADLDTFLARYHGLMLVNADSMKRKERLRKKKAAIKRHATQKARSKAKKGTGQTKTKTKTKTASVAMV